MVLYKGGVPHKIKINNSIAPEVRQLKELTTYGLGGRAEIYFPENLYEAKRAYSVALSHGAPPLVLGNGSDILAADGGCMREIICTKKLTGIVRVADDRLFCLAGTKVSTLLNYCRLRGLGGLEYLVNIPATIGGIAYMNGGAAGKYIGENVVSVTLYNGKTVKLCNYACHYSYKHSTMRDINALILSILLKVDVSEQSVVEERIKEFSRRRRNLPKGKSCGCVFKNPAGDYAARLIEKAGLKGRRIGGAFVSDEHANFIINDGGSASDVFRLISLVREEVKLRFGVTLEEEVIYFGDFER